MELMKRTVEIILLETKEEYKKEYQNIYVNSNFDLFGIPVIFSKEDFDHIFSEPKNDEKERSFSKRRAKRMLFIKFMIDNHSNYELMYEQESKHIALFSFDLEAVIYFIPWPKTKTLRVGTFFDFGKDHAKMYLKQKRKCIEITDKKKLKELLFE